VELRSINDTVEPQNETGQQGLARDDLWMIEVFDWRGFVRLAYVVNTSLPKFTNVEREPSKQRLARY